VEVVIRFVAMESIPEKRLTQEKAAAKRRVMERADGSLKDVEANMVFDG